MKIGTAVVLAGGPGMRLKPLTDTIPKAMVEVYGKPLLQWIIEWLRDNEVKRIIVGVAHLKEKIIDYFGDGTKFNVHLTYSTHTVEGGTGEGFRLAISRYVDQDVFFAMNGDQITDLKLSNLANFHAEHDPLASIAVTNPHCPYGHIEIDDEYNVLRFLEKPSCPQALCSIGIYVFNREILSHLPEKGDVEKTTLPQLAKSHHLKVFPFRGSFITVNTSKDIDEAEQELRRMYG